MGSTNPDLPFIDEHRTIVPAPPAAVWTALHGYVQTSLGIRERNPLAWVLGTRPRTGFGISHEVPMRELGMAGRHRFSEYLLVFHLAEEADGQTALSARSYAKFPGLPGLAYRALVIGTGGHVLATNRILRSVRDRSVGQTGER